MRIGIDLGGTKIEGIAIADEGHELARTRVPTPRGDYDGTLAAIAGVVRQLQEATDLTGSVGIGIPGTVSPATGLIKNANSTWLNGRTFVSDLERRLGQAVRVANDANCFTLSEATDGAAEGARMVFGVILGTGTGGGIVVSGEVLAGPNAIAGEWGHNPLPWPHDDERPGPHCYCGKHGCIETFLSGPGLAGDYTTHSGRAATAESVVAAAAAGETAADEALRRYEHRLARALASVVNMLDPDVIVLGGGLSKIQRLYERVPELCREFVFSAGARGDELRTRLLPARHGDSSGVRGAAWLWPALAPHRGPAVR